MQADLHSFATGRKPIGCVEATCLKTVVASHAGPHSGPMNTDTPTEVPAVSDPRALRDALATFTTGVTIVTTRNAAGAPFGVTVNSFNSVSLDPPLVLWSLAKTSRSLEAFEQAEYWAVHILSAEQDALSTRFARPSENKFEGIELESGLQGTPLLPRCTTRLQCRTSFRYEGGDHIIFVGQIVAFDRSERAPLVFHGGKYAVATPKTPPLTLAPRAGAPIDTRFGEERLGYLLWRASQQFHLRMQPTLAARQLTQEELVVLMPLFHNDGRSVSAFCSTLADLGLDAATSTLDRLVARGLIRIEADTGRLFLTSCGRQEILQVFAMTQAIESECLSRLGDWDSVSLKNLLKLFIVQTNPGLPHPWDPENAVPQT
jgi:3-hydroxy-9,10-secoandrosta-1,3,5(10)-triene-9,17-dione monooxygenase reductase component